MFSINSVPYLFFIFFSLFFALVSVVSFKFAYIPYESKVQIHKLSVGLVIFASLFFMGLRGDIFSDMSGYHEMYNVAPDIFGFSERGSHYHIGISSREPGFIFYMFFMKTFFHDFGVFVFISFLIDLLIMFYVAKRYTGKYVALAIVVFYIMGGIMIEANLLRNSKALMCFLLSLPFLENKKFVQYLLLNVLGSLFHATGLLFIPLYFILNKKWNRKLVFLIFIMTNIIYISNISFLQPLLQWIADIYPHRLTLLASLYMNVTVRSTEGITVGYLERNITFLLLFFNYYKLLKDDKRTLIFINMFYLLLFTYLLFAENVVMAVRISGLFIFSYPIVYPKLFSFLKGKPSQEIVLIIFCLYSFAKYAGYGNVHVKDGEQLIYKNVVLDKMGIGDF
jgi:hypothetical protein